MQAHMLQHDFHLFGQTHPWVNELRAFVLRKDKVLLSAFQTTRGDSSQKWGRHEKLLARSLRLEKCYVRRQSLPLRFMDLDPGECFCDLPTLFRPAAMAASSSTLESFVTADN